MSTPVLKFAVFSIFFSLLSGAVLGQSNPSSFTTLRPATVLNTGDTISGPVPTSQPMHIVVALKLNNEPQLQAFIADPGHAELTPAQFMAQYSPTIAQAQAVADYLTQSGCQNVTISANRLLVSADCTAAVTEAAFQTNLVSVRTHVVALPTLIRQPSVYQRLCSPRLLQFSAYRMFISIIRSWQKRKPATL